MSAPFGTPPARVRHDLLRAGLMLTLLASVGASAVPQKPVVPDDVAPEVQQLTARTVRTYTAREADQGVAVDRTHFYAIDNAVIAKYTLSSGTRVGEWTGRRNGPIRHLNSCLADAGRLRCANSNYPMTPMGSSVEVFDTGTLGHVESHSLGLMDEGSLTWFDRYAGGWVAGFAHYDDNGGLPYKGHRYASVVTFDSMWRRTGGWLFPDSVLERFAPRAASGGAIGPDGYLYLLGHDRPEMYVVARPSMGPVLVHVATIALEVEGQAFSWAQDGSRTAFTIDRRRGLVRAIQVPAVRLAPSAGGLSFR